MSKLIELDKDMFGKICRNGNMEIVKIAVKHIKSKHNSNNRCDYWNSGLLGACEGGHLSIVNLMIELGADRGCISKYAPGLTDRDIAKAIIEREKYLKYYLKCSRDIELMFKLRYLGMPVNNLKQDSEMMKKWKNTMP